MTPQWICKGSWVVSTKRSELQDYSFNDRTVSSKGVLFKSMLHTSACTPVYTWVHVDMNMHEYHTHAHAREKSTENPVAIKIASTFSGGCFA